MNTHLPLSIGYPSTPVAEFASRMASYTERVGEVYFAWPGQSSGRPQTGEESLDDQIQRMQRELALLRNQGFSLHLLFNANCYGEHSFSTRLSDEVCATIRAVESFAGMPEGITTTSPAIAFVIKQLFPDIRVRASVNMKIGSIRAMQMSADLFDDFCVQREWNRSPEHLRTIKKWADQNGHRIFLLANSGCMRDCPGQIFHDNFVAHDSPELQETPINGFIPFACWRHLQDPSNHQAFLQATWIRPEDLTHYEGLAHGIKLATRTHPRPFQVIRAYADRQFTGNLLDLLEPGNGQFLAGRIIDNTRFPPEWHSHAVECPAHGACPTCKEILTLVCIAPQSS